MFCKKCGNKIFEKSKFCDKCGSSVNLNNEFNKNPTSYKCEQCGEKTKDKEINHKENNIKIYNISIAQLIILIIFGIVFSFFCFIICEDSYTKNSELYGFLGIFILFLIPFYIFGWAKNKKRK